MASVFDVAKYILEKKGPMSTWKLQKLCYYSQAWSLAWDETQLFEEEFEAWVNGPVCRDLFNNHRGMYFISIENMNIGNSQNLDADQLATVDAVLDFYGDKEPHWLRETTHMESPWIKARAGLPDDAPCDNRITKDSMGEYYGSL